MAHETAFQFEAITNRRSAFSSQAVQGNVSLNNMSSLNGFSRASVEVLAFKKHVDSHLAWLGGSIGDKLCASLSEASDKLNAGRKACTKKAWLVVAGKNVRKVWHAEVLTDGKGLYVRDGGDAGQLVGSVELLKAQYGPDVKFFASRAEAEKSFNGQKSFNPIVVAAKAEKAKPAVKVAAKATVKGKLTVKRK